MGCDSSINTEKPVSANKENVEIEAAVKMAMGRISYTEPFANIEIHFSCTDLPKTGIFDKADPFIVMYIKANQGEWEKVGITEAILNSTNPKFITTINCKYLFEEKQYAKVEVYYQITKDYEKLANQELIGTAEFMISQIVKASQNDTTKKILGKYNKGLLNICVQAANSSHEYITMQATIKSTIPQMMAIISKQKDIVQQNAEWIPIYKTEVINSINLTDFSPILLPVIEEAKPFLFEIYE